MVSRLYVPKSVNRRHKNTVNLQDVVNRATLFNRSPSQRAVATLLLADASPSHNDSTALPNGGEAHAPLQNGGPAAGPPHEEPEALLLRQETDGGAMLIRALLRCIPPNGGDPGDELAEEAEARLLDLCRHLINEAAEAGTDRTGARASLVELVLAGYSGLGSTACRHELPVTLFSCLRCLFWLDRCSADRTPQVVFPQLAQLIRAPQPAVRCALADLLGAQLPPMLPELEL